LLEVGCLEVCVGEGEKAAREEESGGGKDDEEGRRWRVLVMWFIE